MSLCSGAEQGGSMTEARKLTNLVIKFFEDRAGFDHWWDSLEPGIKKQIRADLEEELANTVPPHVQ